MSRGARFAIGLDQFVGNPDKLNPRQSRPRDRVRAAGGFQIVVYDLEKYGVFQLSPQRIGDFGSYPPLDKAFARALPPFDCADTMRFIQGELRGCYRKESER